MNPISFVAELLDDPQSFIDRAAGRELGRAGIAGYLIAALSIFIFLRLFSAVPPGAYSFTNILALSLGAGFVFASVVHLFLEMTGARGDAIKLFFLLGLTDFFWALLIPLGLMAKLGYLSPASDFLLCFIVVSAARISAIRLLYYTATPKAVLSISLPYAALFAGCFLLFVYGIVYLVWLVI